jgi:signal transduction histidine kinase
MESLGTLSGGIAHEFNNILGIVLGNTELALEDIPESNLAGRYLQEIRKASLRGKEIVRQLMSFSQNSSQIKKPLNLSAIARESIGLLRAAIPANITFQEEIADDCRIIMGDQTQLHQVIINLCTNAAHAMEENGGRLTVRVGNVIGKDKEPFFDKILEPGAYVRLVVSDTGFGIPEAIRERVFDPFYSTKEVGKGSGMGPHRRSRHYQQPRGRNPHPRQCSRRCSGGVLFSICRCDARQGSEPAGAVAGGKRVDSDDR